MSREREFDVRELTRERSRALFELGQVVSTPGALGAVGIEELTRALSRHQSRDWGELDEEDRESNGRALKDGTRLFSRYVSASGQPFWIITEWDRSVTTVLLPEEY